MRKYPCPKCESRSENCSTSDMVRFYDASKKEIIISIFCWDCCHLYEEVYGVLERKGVRLVE